MFSRAEFGVDVLKTELPADLRYAAEFAHGAFDGRERTAVYRLRDCETFCHELDAAAGRPWVILSAGVGMDEFLESVHLASAAGASGFLCGRALWQEALRHYPGLDAMRADLLARGIADFARLNAAAAAALPWHDHRSIGGRAALALPDNTFV